MDHKINDLIAKRYSPRAFSERIVEKEKLDKMFEAARWAPSSFNDQPWSFIFASKENKKDFYSILDTMVEFNRNWAKTAPMLIAAIARKNFEVTGKKNLHAWYDVGQSVAMMSLQATEMGLFLHQMAGFSHDKAAQVLEVPDTHQVVTLIAAGYLGDKDILPSDIAKNEDKPRVRKKQQDFVFSGKWGRGF